MQELEDEIHKIGMRIGILENALDMLTYRKAEIEQDLSQMQGFG